MFLCVYNVVKGGGVNISMNYLKFLLEKGHKVSFLYPYNNYYIDEVNNLKIKYGDYFTPVKFYPLFNFILFKPFINYIYLPILTLFIKPKKVFNFSNIAFPCSSPQFLLMHNAFVIAENRIFSRFSLKDTIYLKLMTKYILFNLKFATKIGVQTNTILNKLNSNFLVSKKLIIIPNVVISYAEKNVEINNFNNKINLLFLSKYYPHKNFEILFKIADKLSENNIIINLTLDEKIESEKKIINKIKNLGYENVLNNIGYVSHDMLSNVYKQNDGLFLPTLLESFSTNYIEAFNFRIPIFTSNLDFAIEVCEDSAFYFDPFDGDNIISCIINAFDDKNLIRDKVNRGSFLLKEKYCDTSGVYDRIFNSIE
jgi:glycosyltransferase involved in cell wall biosynthesis